MEKKMTCPYCGKEEFIDAVLNGYSQVTLYTGILHQAPTRATVCRTCGTVVRLFTDRPEKLVKK